MGKGFGIMLTMSGVANVANILRIRRTSHTTVQMATGHQWRNRKAANEISRKQKRTTARSCPKKSHVIMGNKFITFSFK